MYAVIEACGRQYKVQDGDVLFMEKLGVEPGETVRFDKVVFLSDNDESIIGKPWRRGRGCRSGSPEKRQSEEDSRVQIQRQEKLQAPSGSQTALYEGSDQENRPLTGLTRPI